MEIKTLQQLQTALKAKGVERSLTELRKEVERWEDGIIVLNPEPQETIDPNELSPERAMALKETYRHLTEN
jgi:hypothetical protein